MFHLSVCCVYSVYNPINTVLVGNSNVIICGSEIKVNVVI